jgi:hypothetical protein
MSSGVPLDLVRPMCDGFGVVEHKDVILALMGASAGLGGLVLVFLGFLISALGSFPAGTDRALLNPYRWTALLSGAAFLLSVITVALTAWWLAGLHDNASLYGWSVATFAVQLALLLVSAGLGTYQLVWKA